MSYAESRTIQDADSHIMELPDFLVAHADPHMRESSTATHRPVRASTPTTSIDCSRSAFAEFSQRRWTRSQPP